MFVGSIINKWQFYSLVIFHVGFSSAHEFTQKYSPKLKSSMPSSYLTGLLESWNQLDQAEDPQHHKRVHILKSNDVDIASRTVSVPHPDLGRLTDLMFLLLPSEFPASGLVRLSRSLFESEECVEYVGCEMSKMTYRHKSMHWLLDFLQDFPFQGDLADKLKLGSVNAITKLRESTKKQGEAVEEVGNNKNDKFFTEELKLCSFSCNPIRSLSRGLKILSLFHDLARV